MRLRRTQVVILLSMALTTPALAQQRTSQQPATPPTQSSPQALTLLQQSLAALIGGQPITDVTLSGTARRIAGSDDESGTSVLKALAPGAARQETAGQSSTTTVQRDPQAVAILQKSVAAMASNVPTDSSATGTVTIVEGSTTQTGTIQILTRGTGQTAETLTLPDGQRAVIYSSGDAKEVTGRQSVNPPLELIVTDQCLDFPLPVLLSVLNNADQAVRYLGQETLNGVNVHHIHVWNTFASNSTLVQLAPFSAREIWLDATSALPLKIGYTRRAGEGAVPSFPVEVFFLNYNNAGGVLYPFQIKKSFNGTPWQTITIQGVSLNTGLTDTQFQVE